MNRSPSAYRWNATAGRYVNARGRFVSAQAVRAELDKSIELSAQAVRAASEAVRAGRMPLSQWQLLMSEHIRNSHLAANALAKGGWAQVTRADEQRAARAIREQYEYLRKFAADVAAGRQKLDGTFQRRAELYIHHARTTYETARKREEAIRGMAEERRIRNAKDSCPTCISEAARGWQPIGTLRAIGDSECLSRCRCEFEYREAQAA